MANYYPFEIHTPYRRFYAGSVEYIIVRLLDGDIGVYANHSFFISPVSTGVVKIKDDQGTVRSAFTTEGVLEVKGHKSVLLVDAAEWPKEIDVPRAEEEKKRSLEALSSDELFEARKAKISLARAEARLKAASLATS